MSVLAFLTLALLQPATPFLYSSRLIFVEASVNGRDHLLFLVDTGANKSAIDSQTAKALGLRGLGATTVEGTGGTSQVSRVRLDSLAVAGASARGLEVTESDLGGIPGPEGRHVDGILGTDFLRGRVVSIDFQNKQLAISSRPGKLPSNLKPVPFRWDNGIPRIVGKLNGIDAEFRLDTGASLFETADVYVNIPTATWEALTSKDPLLKPAKYFTGSGVGGEVKLAVAQLDRMTLGPVEIAHPFVIVQPRAGYFSRLDAAGFVSNNLLDKYGSVVLDFRKGRIYLGPENQ